MPADNSRGCDALPEERAIQGDPDRSLCVLDVAASRPIPLACRPREFISAPGRG